MKKNLFTVLTASLIFMACGAEKKEEKENKAEPSITETEKEQPKKKDIVVEEEKSVTTYILENGAVGKFKLYNPIPFPETSENYKINKEIQTRMTEEGPFEETVYIVSENGQETMQLKPAFDMGTGEYTNNINEIVLTTSVVKTNKGIGVGSTIEEFISSYPNYRMWYTHVSGMYVIESDDIKAQFILNEADFTGKIEIDGDMSTLKKEDFKEGSKIIKVRVL